MNYVGFDIGSSSINAAVIDDEGNLKLVKEWFSHFGIPLKRLPEIWKLINTKIEGKIISTAFTGIGAQYFNKVFSSSLFDYESVSIPKDAFFLSGMLLMPFI